MHVNSAGGEKEKQASKQASKKGRKKKEQDEAESFILHSSSASLEPAATFQLLLAHRLEFVPKPARRVGQESSCAR